MNKEHIQQFRKDIISIGQMLWQKDLVTGLNGNISLRVEADTMLLTGRGTCLGLLKEKDLILMKTSGELLEKGEVSSERLMHTEILKNFPETQAVIHTHTPYTNGYFLENDTLTSKIYEAKFYLGDVKAIPQHTPAVSDIRPVIEAFKRNNIVVLKNHGVVAMGKNLFDCFLLIQALEEAVKTDVVSRLYRNAGASVASDAQSVDTNSQRKYKLFSKEQINDIVKFSNADAQLNDLGQKTQMTMDLAVKLDETGQVYSFHFENGMITSIGNDENVEFLVSAPEKIWRAVFNQEIDPFVATTQKKMNLRGDFAKLSKWYAPCSRVFELWQRVPVE